MISVRHLTKYYGEHLAVDDLSFEIGDGHVYGFLGPNGAGKSTTMNIMTGCLSATEGTVEINGHDILEDPREAKKLIGYLPEQPPLYMMETPEEYLRFVGEAKGLRGEELENQISSAIQRTGIANVSNRRISTLSKGYKQRVGVAQALMGNPQVIILDEPTVGLDPLQVIEIRELIKELGRDHTVILSSHILSEVQTVCDRIIIISKGHVVANDDSENLEKKMVSSSEISVTTESPATEILKGIEGIVDVTEIESADGYYHVVLRGETDDVYKVARKVFLCCSMNGIILLEMGLKKLNLEDVFIELTSGETADRSEGSELSPDEGNPRESGYSKSSYAGDTDVVSDCGEFSDSANEAYNSGEVNE